jgi:hypothetical protein
MRRIEAATTETLLDGPDGILVFGLEEPRPLRVKTASLKASRNSIDSGEDQESEWE